MEKQNNKNTESSEKSASTSGIQQSRGPELREKMEESAKKGEQYRTEHQGQDTVKQPGTSNSEKTH